jgi:hypothetical protein
MEKTAYQRFLERVRHRIDGKAWEALQNHDDPARFEQLEALHSDPKVRQRIELLGCLYALESTPEKKPFDCWLAMLWSGKARIKAPLWAVKTFEEIGNGRLSRENKQDWSLDKAFGFQGFGRETPDVFKRLSSVRHDYLFREIWDLELLEFSVRAACLMVARRYQRDVAQHDSQLAYGRWRLGQGDHPDEDLRKKYPAWRTANEALLRLFERNRLVWLAGQREQYLRRFPADSLPKASIVERARLRFEQKISEL